MEKRITWRYDFEFSKDNTEEVTEIILKDFRWVKEQPAIIEINTVGHGIVIAEKLIAEGLPIKKMAKLKRGWVEA